MHLTILYIYDSAFDAQWLIGIEFIKKEYSSYSWSDLNKLTSVIVTKIFTGAKIIMCKRNAVGQVYVAEGFKDMVHFTVGPDGKTRLTTFFKRHEVPFFQLKGEDSDPSHPSWFQVSSLSAKNSKDKDFLNSVDDKLKSIAATFVPELLKVCIMSDSL